MCSVFLWAQHLLMYEAFVRRLLDCEYTAEGKTLKTEPVVGALLAAAAQAGVDVDEEIARRLEESIKDYIPKER